MKITEKRLRQIIRETLLEEQHRVDESAKDAITKGLMALMATYGGAAVVDAAIDLNSQPAGIHVTTGSQFGGGMNIDHEKLPDEIAKEIDEFLENPNLEDAARMDGYTAKYRYFGGAGMHTKSKDRIQKLTKLIHKSPNHPVLKHYKGAAYKG